jgi:hypothetical protein
MILGEKTMILGEKTAIFAVKQQLLVKTAVLEAWFNKALNLGAVWAVQEAPSGLPVPTSVF